MRSIAEQKNSIIQGILNVDNPAVLSEFEDLFLLNTPCPDILPATPENLRRRAIKAIEQGKNGEYISHEEVLEMFSFIYE